MKMIYKIAHTELQTLFYSPVAWLILVIFAFQMNMVFTDTLNTLVLNQEMGYNVGNITMLLYAGYVGLFTNIQQYLYLYIPLLTMGLMSRELNSGSIKLLYSSPTTNTEIILGKYLSIMIYGLVLMGITMIPVTYSAITIKAFDFSAVMAGMLGLYLLTCAYAAIGLFMSSLTSYQVVAAIGTLATLAVLNFVGKMWQDIEFIRDITYWLSINGRVSEFINGLICSEDVLYFLIVIGLFLTLSILRLNVMRQKIKWTVSISKYVGVFVLAMMLGYITSRPKLMFFYDATQTKSQTLTPNSQEIIKKMDGGLTINTYVNILDRSFHEGMPKMVKSDMQRFRQYWRFKPEIKFKYIYYYDKAENPNLERSYPDLSDRERMVKMAESWRIDSNMFKTPEEIKKTVDLAPESNRFVRLLERDNGEKTFLRIYDDMFRHPDEPQITAAFKRLVMKLPCVGFISGHGERDCIREGDRHYNRFAQEKPFRYSLINNGFDFEQITLEQDIPSHINIIVIADMRTSLTKKEEDILNRYIERGGNILIAGEPNRQEVMNPLISRFGVQLLPGRLVKETENFQPDFILSSPTPEAGQLSYHFNDMLRGEFVVTMPGCCGLEYTTDKGYDITPLFVSDTNSWNELQTTDFIDDTVRFNPETGEIIKSYTTALALSREINGKLQKIIILGDADCLSNSEISIGRKGIRASNFSLITGAFFWMSDEEVPIDVRRPNPPDNQLYLTNKGLSITKIGLMGVVPILLALSGILIWIRRRGR